MMTFAVWMHRALAAPHRPGRDRRTDDRAAAAAVLAHHEKIIIDASKAPSFSVARLRQPFAEQEDIH